MNKKITIGLIIYECIIMSVPVPVYNVNAISVQSVNISIFNEKRLNESIIILVIFI